MPTRSDLTLLTRVPVSDLPRLAAGLGVEARRDDLPDSARLAPLTVYRLTGLLPRYFDAYGLAVERRVPHILKVLETACCQRHRDPYPEAPGGPSARRLDPRRRPLRRTRPPVGPVRQADPPYRTPSSRQMEPANPPLNRTEKCPFSPRIAPLFLARRLIIKGLWYFKAFFDKKVPQAPIQSPESPGQKLQ